MYIYAFANLTASDCYYLPEIEVYKFPEDCVYEEILSHFEDVPYRASCVSSDQCVWNEISKTFVLEFNTEGNTFSTYARI